MSKGHIHTHLLYRFVWQIVFKQNENLLTGFIGIINMNIALH